MMKTQTTSAKSLSFFLGGCLMASVPLLAEKVVNADQLPEPMNLNGDWQFQFAADAATADLFQDFASPDFDASGFDTIPVPSNWNMLGYEDPHWVNGTTSEGFYRLSFEAPSNLEGILSTLHFGGVWVSAEVWLNGQSLGQHDSGFTAFAFDLSDAIKPGESNLLAVRVRQQLPNNLFKFDANDDWGLAGIYRDVWIDFKPEFFYIGAVDVETDFDDSFTHADLLLRVFVFRHENDDYFAPSPPFELHARLSTLDGETVTEWSETARVMGPHNGRDVRLKIPVQNPLQWTAETPNLYNLHVELVRDDAVIHSWSDRIGFREVSTDGGVFRINGQAVKLRGVNRHDLHPDVGRATRHEHWLEDIRLMKEANINAVRMAHYPHAEGFVRLCDELGLYVLNEIPLGFGGDRLGKPEFAEGMLLRIHETIQRDRNRPSVVVWDFGNEDPFTQLHLVGLKVIKGLDTTRPVLLPFRFDDNLPPEVDILAPHYWKTQDYDRLAAEARRPVITTEFTHALGQRDFGEMQQRWEALTSHPAGAGGFIWIWADQGLKRPVGDRPVYHPMEDKDKYTREGGELVREMDAGEGFIYDSHGNYGTDGVVNTDRSPQRDYWEVKAVYAPVRVMVDRLDWQPGQLLLSVPVRNDFDFTNLAEVTLGWTLYRDHLPLQSGTAVLEGEPHTTQTLDIPLEDVGYAAGTYYLHVSALDSNGTSLMRQGIRLDGGPVHPPQAKGNGQRAVVEETDQIIAIRSGGTEYVISKKTGELAEIRQDGQVLAGNAGFVVWRPSTYSERNRYDKRKDAPDWNTFMQDLEPVADSVELINHGGNVTVSARSTYAHDKANQVHVHYDYSVLNDGSLEIAFTAEIQLELPEIPEIGLTLEVMADLDRLIWMGEGPYSSVPGKTAATCFGWWAGAPGSSIAEGTKSGLDWAKLDFSTGQQLHFRGQEGVRLQDGSNGGYQLRLLTRLAGAWTKNGPAERAEWHLAIDGPTRFSGKMVITPTRR